MQPFHAREIAFGLGLDFGSYSAGGGDHPRLLPGLPRSRRDHGGDQPAGDHGRRRVAGAGRQDELRRQRPLPPAPHRRAARQIPGGSARNQGDGPRPQLCRARGQYRLHHQRCRARHGDHGHDQACRRRAGELPRHRRWRHAGAGGQGLQSRAFRRQGGGDAGEYLRRHQPLRLGRPRHRAGPAESRDARAAGGAPRRHPCRGGPRDPGRAAFPSSPPTASPRRRRRSCPPGARPSSCSPGRKRHEHPSR